MSLFFFNAFWTPWDYSVLSIFGAEYFETAGVRHLDTASLSKWPIIKKICTYSLHLKYIHTKSRSNSAKSVSNFLVFPDLPKAAKIDIKYQSCLNKMDNQNITLVSLYRSVKGRNKNYFKEMFVVFVRCRRGRNSLGKSLLIAIITIHNDIPWFLAIHCRITIFSLISQKNPNFLYFPDSKTAYEKPR